MLHKRLLELALPGLWLCFGLYWLALDKLVLPGLGYSEVVQLSCLLGAVVLNFTILDKFPKFLRIWEYLVVFLLNVLISNADVHMYSLQYFFGAYASFGVGVFITNFYVEQGGNKQMKVIEYFLLCLTIFYSSFHNIGFNYFWKIAFLLSGMYLVVSWFNTLVINEKSRMVHFFYLLIRMASVLYGLGALFSCVFFAVLFFLSPRASAIEFVLFFLLIIFASVFSVGGVLKIKVVPGYFLFLFLLFWGYDIYCNQSTGFDNWPALQGRAIFLLYWMFAGALFSYASYRYMGAAYATIDRFLGSVALTEPLTTFEAYYKSVLLSVYLFCLLFSQAMFFFTTRQIAAALSQSH